MDLLTKIVQGIVKRAQPCKYNILLVLRILWHNTITTSLKELNFSYWYSPATFLHNCSLQVYAAPFHWRLPIFIGKNLWRKVLEASNNNNNNTIIIINSYSLKNWFCQSKLERTKKKLHKPVTLIYWPELQIGTFRVYIFMSIK